MRIIGYIAATCKPFSTKCIMPPLQVHSCETDSDSFHPAQALLAGGIVYSGGSLHVNWLNRPQVVRVLAVDGDSQGRSSGVRFKLIFNI